MDQNEQRGPRCIESGSYQGRRQWVAVAALGNGGAATALLSVSIPNACASMIQTAALSKLWQYTPEEAECQIPNRTHVRCQALFRCLDGDQQT
jgi:hypothetical protein